MKFSKYHGAGNDFILIKLASAYELPGLVQQLVTEMCARHTGIGADGVIFWYVEMNAPPRMIYYNSDGAPSSFCGNGSRCFIKCLHEELMLQESTLSFRANDGLHTGELLPDGRVRVSMQVVGELSRHAEQVDIIDTGSPHYVEWCSVLPKGEIVEQARQVRYSSAFAKTGINVNYVATAGSGLAIRTYERGVEAETLACGTGVTAAALSFAERQQLTGNISVSVQARGGLLHVDFSRTASGLISEVYLTGPAVRVFEGVWLG